MLPIKYVSDCAVLKRAIETPRNLCVLKDYLRIKMVSICKKHVLLTALVIGDIQA